LYGIHSEDWRYAPRIYVENLRDRDPAYQVTADAVLKRLEPVCCPADVTCRFADERDPIAWRRADILIAGRLDTRSIAGEAEDLKLIQCTSAGVENYTPFDWLRPGVTLTNASGVHAGKIAEFGLMAALMLHERVPAMATNQRHHLWKRELRGLAAGRRVLIHGVGALGGAVAERLRNAGFRVTGVRRSDKPHPAIDHMTTPERFREALPRAEILILACPLTPETRGIIGTRELALLPPGAALLNIARAGVVDHAALACALETGHLSGAILDVFEKEPLPENSPLWDVRNLMIFPHVSADAPDGYVDRCLQILADNIERLQSDRPLRNRVEPSLGY
jgi:phosphoglycerate dehydrogenase-like enzyme